RNRIISIRPHSSEPSRKQRLRSIPLLRRNASLVFLGGAPPLRRLTQAPPHPSASTPARRGGCRGGCGRRLSLVNHVSRMDFCVSAQPAACANHCTGSRGNLAYGRRAPL